MNKEALSVIRCVSYITKTKTQTFYSPIWFRVTKNNRVFVYDSNLSKLSERDESWWPFRFMFDISCMDLARVSGEDVILFGDEYGNVLNIPMMMETAHKRMERPPDRMELRP